MAYFIYGPLFTRIFIGIKCLWIFISLLALKIAPTSRFLKMKPLFHVIFFELLLIVQKMKVNKSKLIMVDSASSNKIRIMLILMLLV